MFSKKIKIFLFLIIIVGLLIHLILANSQKNVLSNAFPQKSSDVQKNIESQIQIEFEKKVKKIIGTNAPKVPNTPYGKMLVEAQKTMAIAKASSGLFNAQQLRTQAFDTFLQHPQATAFVSSVYTGPLQNVPWEELGMTQAEWRYYGTKLAGYLASQGQIDLGNTIVATLSQRLQNDRNLDNNQGFIADLTDTVWEVLDNTKPYDFETAGQILVASIGSFEDLPPNATYHLKNIFFSRCMKINKQKADLCLETVNRLVNPNS